MQKTFSPRVMVAILVAVTFALLVGSAALQRLVFKADQVSSALFITPERAAIKPGESVTFALKATFGAPATVTAAQVVLEVNDALVEIVEAKPAEKWQSKKFVSENGHIAWALLPATSNGPTLELNGTVTLGTVTLQGLAEGAFSLKPVLGETILAAVDPLQAPSLYNAAVSLQSAAVTVAATAVTTTPTTLPAEDVDAELQDGEVQRLVSVEAVVASRSALLAIRSRYPAKIKVEYGSSPTLLTNQLETVSFGSPEAAVRLQGLSVGTRYYYRITLLNAAGTSRAVGKVRSFQTLNISAGAEVGTVVLVATPTAHQNTSTLYMVALSPSGEVVTDAKPTLLVTSGVAKISLVTGEEIYQATLTSSLTTKQPVTVEARVGTVSASQVVRFDPNLVVEKEPSATTTSLAWDRPVQLMLFGLLAGLVILVLVFVKLARVK